jgi:hypothetical protein
MMLPKGFNSTWAMEELRRYLEVSKPLGNAFDGIEAAGGFDSVIEQSSIIAPILAAVLPNWREECATDDYYRFAQEREAATRAWTLLARQDEMAENLGEADASMTAAHFHPWVWEPARSLWRGGHYRGALQTAATALDNQLQALSQRSDVQGTPLVQQLLSEKAPEPGKPRLNLPSIGNDENDKNLRGGMRGLGETCFSLVRNLTTHNLDEFTEQEALEQMAVLSLFARRVEEYGVTTG